jgi:hypothetical protein
VPDLIPDSMDEAQNAAEIDQAIVIMDDLDEMEVAALTDAVTGDALETDELVASSHKLFRPRPQRHLADHARRVSDQDRGRRGVFLGAGRLQPSP